MRASLRLRRHARMAGERRRPSPAARRPSPGVASGDPFDGHRDRAAAAEAERREPEPALAADELMGERRHDAGATRPDRVPESDRTAVDIDLRPVEPEGATISEGLGGKGLIDLDEVERLDRHLDPVEKPADALDRRQEEPLRLDLGLGIPDDPNEWREAESLDGPLARDDGGGGPIRDTGRIA